ncbi:protein transport protein Sec24-like At3g07100 [Diospyros lotus]|uniref:protein transport protein Sec24-like At3g07100 n=1 Tax=Diospyros lotus TaxID=55363 RepID=UPI00224D79E8|nr:protein transport protein Sec24-like At3g07100 [Diospyros lotus]XP_052169872.1 protein transport protein Sec24-like At3g07100 [Diospyros lotus]
MNPMGTVNPGSGNIHQRPPAPSLASSSQSSTPFLSSGPMVGSEASAFRPLAPNAPQTKRSSSSSVSVFESEVSGFKPTQTGVSNDPSMLTLPSSYPPPPAGPFQHFPSPQFSSTAQLSFQGLSAPGQPVYSSPVRPPAGQVPSPPVSLYQQPQIRSVPMGSIPQTISNVPPGMNFPPSSLDSSFPTPRPNLQPAFPSYPSNPYNAVTQPSPVQSSHFVSRQGDYGPPPTGTSSPFLAHQGGYVPPPPVAAPPGVYSREQMQHQGSGPPIGAAPGLIEDFSSLYLASVPGSIDPQIDFKALPRPLDDDLEIKNLADVYPLNCDSRYLRFTTSGIPNSQSLASRWHLPLGAIVCPLAETPDGNEVPVVNFAPTGIIRCRKCRAYVNPYVTFMDGGRKWRCNICAFLNDVPGDYFAHLDASGRRVDWNERPELKKGSVEFTAPSEYMVRPPMPPLYFFLIDVSVLAVRSGMLEVVAQTIKSCLDRLPGFPRTQIGFITFDSTIHFYNMKSSLTQPQMLVISDLDDIFVPLPDDLLVNLSESRGVVDAFLDSLSFMFQENVNVESAFGPALKAAYMVMAKLGGKLLIFQNTLPSLGVGRLRMRGDDPLVYGTEKEHALRIPEDPFYKQMAADCTKCQIAVNVYAFSDKYTDIASLGTLAKYTGGQVYFYPSFHAAIHKEKLRHELARDLTRGTAWEAVMRIRCSKGVRFTSYHGNFMLRSTDLLALPAVDCDKAYAMQLSLEETLLTTQTVYFQVALLCTSSSGERRIRVHTAAVPVVADLGEMYRQADNGAIVSLLCRLAIEKTLNYKLEEARNLVQQRIVKALREYRNLYAVQHRVVGQMIYPESLKFLPLYGLALCKSMPLRGGYADVQLDERCAAGHTMMAIPVKRLLKLLYPHLVRVDGFLIKANSKADQFNISRLPLTAESLDSKGLYIYDDGFRFIIWFGRMLSPDIVMNLLGEDCAADFSRVVLSKHDSEMSRKLMAILTKLRESDTSYYQQWHLVRQDEQPREGILFLTNLVEDTVGNMNGYMDWILQIHRQVQQNA